MKKYIIVVAGGKGMRKGGEMPKQFQLLGNKPVVMVTLERLYMMAPEVELVMVLPAEHFELWNELCAKYEFAVPVKLAKGGSTRFHSVQNGLAMIEDSEDAVVGVHDGVRPFVSQKVLEECFREGSEQPPDCLQHQV